jgi:MoxR-like ATPase
MPYVAKEHLVAAAEALRGARPIAVITIPAILRISREEGVEQPTLVPFAGKAEKDLLDMAFRLEPPPSPKTIYRAVWAADRDWVKEDFAGSSLQKQRSSAPASAVLVRTEDDKGRLKELGLQADTGSRLRDNYGRSIRLIDLAIWYGRKKDVSDLDGLLQWYLEEFPVGHSDLIGTLYDDSLPDNYRRIDLVKAPATDADILAALPSRAPPAIEPPTPTPSGEELEAEDFRWTQELCRIPLRPIDLDVMVAHAVTLISERNLIFPDVEDLVRRCILGLRLGHLVLQGPPGTGKTTLARVLAMVFNVALEETTATGDWSSYQVIGGLRPDREQRLTPVLGSVSSAILECANQVQAAEADDAEGDEPQATWLLIDEFNRADIDKAIGPLYTLLSSMNASHLERSPLELWFNAKPEAHHLWMPGRFRIIGAMNDVDTSFVNPISQGLTRRFEFIVVGVPEAEGGASAEILAALRQAHDWLEEEMGESGSIMAWEDVVAALTPTAAVLGDLIVGLRAPEGQRGWPVGSAQVVDVMRSVLLEFQGGAVAADALTAALDRAVADRLVPQMGALDNLQLQTFGSTMTAAGLRRSASAVRHLQDTSASY